LDVYEAVDSRRAVRAFSNEPVSKLRTARADMTETVRFGA
jgi:nitroreductase